MTENIAIVISTTMYKLTSLVVGLLFAYMGFRLFMAGIWGKAGDLEIQSGNKNAQSGNKNAQSGNKNAQSDGKDTHSGNLNAQFGDFKLVLKKAAPGTFFALFGTAIIGFTIYKGMEFENIKGASDSPDKENVSPSQPENPLPDVLPGLEEK